MKMKPLIAFLTVCVALLFPLSATAASSNQDRTRTLYRKLQSLPKEASGFQRVSSILKELIIADPKRTNSYYKLSLTRLSPFDREMRLNRFQTQTINILKRSEKLIAKIKHQIKRKILTTPPE